MKYNILLTGKNDSVMDVFFDNMAQVFDIETTSLRMPDILNHLTYCKPNALVYCMFNETRDDMSRIANLRFRMSRMRIPVIIIGFKEDCDRFEKTADNSSDLTLHMPAAANVIQEKIIELIKESRFMHEVDEISEENAAQTGYVHPGVAQTGYVHSGTAQAGYGYPGTAQTGYVYSGAAQAGYGYPGAAQTGYVHSGVAQTGYVHPGAAQTGYVYSGTAQAGYGYSDTAQAGYGQPRKHILVVDDNAVMLKTIKEHLHGKYDVATAASGKTALKFLERKKTDLILLDYEMPDEKGPAILEKLRSSAATRDIPVIFLTGVTETNKIIEALALKPQSYLLKPVDPAKLMDTIAKTIG